MTKTFYDLTREERERLHEAECRYMARRTLAEVEAVRKAQERTDELIVGFLMKGDGKAGAK